MERPMYYDRQGNAISMEGWSHLHANPDYKRVASTVIPETGLWVSTVWLGLDHGFTFRDDEQHVPIIFETMVFGEDDHDMDMDRYATEEKAIEGHLEMVRKLMGTSVRHFGKAQVPLNDPPPK